MSWVVTLLIFCAAWATGYATVAFLLDRVDYLRRRRIVDRAETWARRERESDPS